MYGIIAFCKYALNYNTRLFFYQYHTGGFELKIVIIVKYKSDI